MQMKIMLDSHGIKPTRAHEYDAGMDIYAPATTMIKAHGSSTIATGVHMEIPNRFVGMIKSKSGLNVKHGIIAEGVIDSGYTGEIMVKLYNLSDDDYIIEAGDKMTQLVVMPVELPDITVVDSLEETERGNGGFGSTGK